MARQLSNTDRRQRVVDEIKRWIILGEIPPGGRVVEAEVTEKLGVSRPTAREALNQLAWSGYLDQTAYRGHRVGVLEPRKIIDFARTRVVLDTSAAEDILDDRTGLRLLRLTDVLDRYCREVDTADPVAIHEAHVRFHRGLWEASENSFLPKLWPAMEAEMSLNLAYDQRQRQDTARAVALHRKLVEVIRSGDRDAIREEIRDHALGSALEVVAMMREGQGD